MIAGKSFSPRALIKTEDRINRWIGLRNVPLIQLAKAEEEIAVASAGIVARAARESWIDSVSNKVRTDLRSLKVIDIPSLKGQAHMLAKLSFVERATRRR